MNKILTISVAAYNVEPYIKENIESIVASNAKEEIAENPMYLILNLARVLAYLRDGVILSKKEGGEWALSNIPERYHSLVQNAMNDYAEGMVVLYDSILAKEYAGFMLEQIGLTMANSL